MIFIALKRPGGEDLNAPQRSNEVPNIHSLIIPYVRCHRHSALLIPPSLTALLSAGV